MQRHTLALHAGRAVDGLGPGAHTRRRAGRTLTFREHRGYQPGDDLRHVDWHVLARRDALMVKVYEDEAPLRVELVLDASGSMGYGNKFDRARVLALATAQVALNTAEEVGLSFVGTSNMDPLRRAVPTRSGRGHLAQVAQALEGATCGGPSPLPAALVALGRTLQRRSHIIVVSDLWLDVGALPQALVALGRRRHDITLVHVWHPHEAQLPPVGAVLWQGMEGDGAILGDSEALRSAYFVRAQAHLEACTRLCTHSTAAYVAAPGHVEDHALLRQVLGAHRRQPVR